MQEKPSSQPAQPAPAALPTQQPSSPNLAPTLSSTINSVDSPAPMIHVVPPLPSSASSRGHGRLGIPPTLPRLQPPATPLFTPTKSSATPTTAVMGNTTPRGSGGQFPGSTTTNSSSNGGGGTGVHNTAPMPSFVSRSPMMKSPTTAAATSSNNIHNNRTPVTMNESSTTTNNNFSNSVGGAEFTSTSDSLEEEMNSLIVENSRIGGCFRMRFVFLLLLLVGIALYLDIVVLGQKFMRDFLKNTGRDVCKGVAANAQNQLNLFRLDVDTFATLLYTYPHVGDPSIDVNDSYTFTPNATTLDACSLFFGGVLGYARFNTEGKRDLVRVCPSNEALYYQFNETLPESVTPNRYVRGNQSERFLESGVNVVISKMGYPWFDTNAQTFMVMLSKEIFGTLLFSTDKASYSTAALLRDTRVALFLAPTTADSGILSGAGGGGTLVGTSDGSTGSSSSDGTDLIPVISTLTTTFPAYNVTQPNDLTIDLANEFRNRCNLGNAFTWSASMETDAREALLTAIPDPYADDDVAVLCGALCFVITNKTTNDTSSSSDADPSSSDAGGFIVSSQRKQCQSATRNVYMVIKTSIQDDQFDSVFSLTNAMATVDIVFSCVIVVSLNITLGFPVFVLNKKIRSVLTGIPMRLGDRRNRGLVATQCLWMSDMKSLMNVFHVMAALFVSNRKYVPDFILHRQLRELREARLFEQTGDDNDMLLGGSDSGGLGGRHSSSMSNLHGGASSVMSGSFAEQDDLNEMDDEMFEEEEDEEDLEEYEESNAEGLAQRLPAGQEEARRSPRALSHSISRGEHDAHHDDGYDEDVEMSFVTAPAGHGKGGGRLSATGRRLQRRTTRNDGDDDEIRRVRRGLRALSLTTANLADTQQQQNKHSRSPSSGPLGSNGPRKGSRSMGGTGDFDSSSSFAATSGTGGGGKMQHLGLLNATSVADLTQSTSAGAFGGTTNSKLKATRRTGSTVAVHVAPEESQPKSGKGGQIASGTAAAVAATNRLPDLNSLCPRNPVTILVLQFVSLEDAFASDFRNAERQHKIVVLAMSTVIRRNRGEIFERSGERVCVAWNAFDHRPDHAQRAAKCAMEIAGLFHQFRQDGMRMGIVLHQGPVVCGVLGDSHGAASLLFGKTADVAQRVAWLATQLPCFNILITEPVKKSLHHTYDCVLVDIIGLNTDTNTTTFGDEGGMQTTVDPANDTALFDVLQQTTHQNQLHHNRDQSFEVSISNLLLNTVNSRASTAQQRSPSPQAHHHGASSSKDSLRIYDIRGSAAGSAALPPRSHQFLNHGADATKSKKNTSMSPAGATGAGDPGNHQWMRKDLLAQYHTAFSHFEHHRFAEALDILGDIAATMNEEDVYDNDDVRRGPGWSSSLGSHDPLVMRLATMCIYFNAKVNGELPAEPSNSNAAMSPRGMTPTTAHHHPHHHGFLHADHHHHPSPGPQAFSALNAIPYPYVRPMPSWRLYEIDAVVDYLQAFAAHKPSTTFYSPRSGGTETTTFVTTGGGGAAGGFTRQIAAKTYEDGVSPTPREEDSEGGPVVFEEHLPTTTASSQLMEDGNPFQMQQPSPRGPHVVKVESTNYDGRGAAITPSTSPALRPIATSSSRSVTPSSATNCGLAVPEPSADQMLLLQAAAASHQQNNTSKRGGFAGLHSMPSEALFSQSMLFGESVTGASAIARMREHHHDDDDDSHEAAQGANKNADRKHSADHGTDMNASNKHTGEKTSSKKAAAINGSCSGSGGEVSNFMRDLKDNMRSQNSKDSQMLTTSSSTESPALKASRNSNGSIAGGGPLADSSSADASGVVANGGDAATANQQRQVTTEVEVGVRRVPDALQQTILQSVMWSLGNSLLSGGGAAKAMQMDDAPPMVKQHSEQQQQMKKQSSIASQGSSAEEGCAAGGGGGGNSGREDSNDGVSDDTPQQQSPTPRQQQQQQPVQPVLMSINPFGGRSVASGPALRETIEAADGTVYVRSSRVLGTGSFGCVYMGMEQHTGRLVAMKFLPLPSDADEIHVLQNEVETMETVMDANLVEFYGYAFVDNMIVLMMECLVAGSLSGMLTTFETLPEPTTINFVRDVLKGLHRLHSMGIVHRDVKPQNVLIAANGHCKISDFGASASINELARRHEGGAEVQGTPIYLAPEAARGHAEPKSDVWSVGIMYLQLITGSIPYDATAMSGGVGAVVFGIGSGKLHPIIPTNLTPFARAFVDGCLAVNVDQRLTANDLLRLPLFDGQF